VRVNLAIRDSDDVEHVPSATSVREFLVNLHGLKLVLIISIFVPQS
jgi:hypothetical protein